MTPPPASLRIKPCTDGFTAKVPYHLPSWLMPSVLTTALLGSALVLVVWDDAVVRAALMLSVVGAGLALLRVKEHETLGRHILTVSSSGLRIRGAESAQLRWTELSRCELITGELNHQLMLYRHEHEPVAIPVAPALAHDTHWLATELNTRILSAPAA